MKEKKKGWEGEQKERRKGRVVRMKGNGERKAVRQDSSDTDCIKKSYAL